MLTSTKTPKDMLHRRQRSIVHAFCSKNFVAKDDRFLCLLQANKRESF